MSVVCSLLSFSRKPLLPRNELWGGKLLMQLSWGPFVDLPMFSSEKRGHRVPGTHAAVRQPIPTSRLTYFPSFLGGLTSNHHGVPDGTQIEKQKKRDGMKLKNKFLGKIAFFVFCFQ